jgi:nitrogen regulatory protein P-II 2
MKLVIAYIQPHKLNDVKKTLYKAEVYKMSVTNALGCGAQQGYEESYRGIKFEVNLLKKVRLEIAVNEDFVERTVEAIIEQRRESSVTEKSLSSICRSASVSGQANAAVRPSDNIYEKAGHHI